MSFRNWWRETESDKELIKNNLRGISWCVQTTASVFTAHSKPEKDIRSMVIIQGKLKGQLKQSD